MPSHTLTPLARRLRSDATDAESRLWSRLRNGALGLRFRRQVPMGAYILDFYCPSAKLVIELDGAHHHEPTLAAADRVRTRALETLGLTVIRFDDNEVLLSLDTVVQSVADCLNAGRPSSDRG